MVGAGVCVCVCHLKCLHACVDMCECVSVCREWRSKVHLVCVADGVGNAEVKTQNGRIGKWKHGNGNGLCRETRSQA